MSDVKDKNGRRDFLAGALGAAGMAAAMRVPTASAQKGQSFRVGPR
jgi:hypothetical protein